MNEDVSGCTPTGGDPHAGQAVDRHGPSGLEGYTSMRCERGVDGCRDLACVCRCHNDEDPWSRP